MSKANEITYATKKEFVRSLCLMYKKTKSIETWALAREPMRVLRDSKGARPRQQLTSAISYFENMLDFLTPPQRQIIEREFIAEETNALWYEEFWSKTRYYQLKNDALDRIINYLYV